MRLSRRATCLAAPALAWRPAWSATKAINLVSGAAPGSQPALWVQGFAPFLERHWPGSGVRVVTIPGERGLLAARSVADAAPGTAGVIATPQLLSQMLETGSTTLLDRLLLVAAVVEETSVLLGQRGDALNSAFRRPTDPPMLIGTPQTGSAPALAARALMARGAAFEPVSFASPAAARKAVETGSVPSAMLALPDAIGSLREGRLAAIGVAALRRVALLPDTPTLGELGQSVTLAGRRGIVLSRQAPDEYRQQMAASLAAIVADPEFVAQSEEQGYLPQLVGSSAWDTECRRLLQSIA